jgi:hypothetical protein
LRGDRPGGGAGCNSTGRIEKRTYRFDGTGQTVEYDVFVSTRVDRRRPSRRDAGIPGVGHPDTIQRGAG